MKYYTQTFGCQQNISDTEKINGMLSEMGFEPTDDKWDADVIIYNTCAVREHAEQRVFGKIGELVQFKRKKPDLIIGICGCMMQQEYIVDDIRKKYKHINMVFGTSAIYRLPTNLYTVLSSGERVFDTDLSANVTEDVPIRRTSKFSAWVSIMYGCNNFCSYCIVPYTRGRERSRPPQVILNEVQQLIKEGYKEITLLGQNVNSYGNGTDWGYNFSRLLKEICEIPGTFRIRFMTSHPKDATRELIDTIASSDKICKHLHLPFQSGNNRILEKMNRRYTKESYLDLIRYAKEKIPDIVLTSDVIVGFPTETDEEFEDTINLIKEVGFGGLFTFIYSIRKGTPAEKMEQVPDEDKKRRFERLIQLQTEKSFEFNSKYMDKTVNVLCDGAAENKEGIFTGRTEGGIIVNFSGENISAGEFYDIKITKTLNWALFGNTVNN
ncbi:MAG: tRNA (N6-isopentenyl adenosine(37)-C2)-methylthiotransferase MiaB [Ruminococcaceae bacterium]|nr:tRNA (N6-isopentenyl adenosine(37)-C2)-methylthiotransferase MiaB [Oscillospiraceae bacterium]